MRTRKAILNVVTSLLSQLVSVVCGFIVPAALIRSFGSETYGAIGSITQFLGFITLLEAGVGGVTRAALYRPLAEGDRRAVSAIVRATESFFRKIGAVFVVYAVVIACAFPYITRFTGEWVLSFTLTLVIAAGTLAQYMFGITYSVLLQADQRSYVTSMVQVVTTAVNAALVVILVRMGCGVVAVQAGSAVVFVLRPIVLGWFVRRRYGIERVEPDGAAIRDRWNGLGHHLAFYFRSNVSVVAASLFLPLSEVSVFTVYNLIASGLQRLVNSFSSGIEAGFGNMIARGEAEALACSFRTYELISSTLVAVVFSTAVVTAVPFVGIYTAGVSDANYARPTFSALLLAATAVYCFRLPYNTVVLAAGHYRQTRNGAFAEAGIAVGLTFALTPAFGIAGAAAALLAATVFRTVQYALYASRNILRRSSLEFLGRVAYVAGVSGVACVAGFAMGPLFPCEGYAGWCLYAVAVFLVALVSSAVVALAFYRCDVRTVLSKLRGLRDRG